MTIMFQEQIPHLISILFPSPRLRKTVTLNSIDPDLDLCPQSHLIAAVSQVSSAISHTLQGICRRGSLLRVAILSWVTERSHFPLESTKKRIKKMGAPIWTRALKGPQRPKPQTSRLVELIKKHYFAESPSFVAFVGKNMFFFKSLKPRLVGNILSLCVRVHGKSSCIFRLRRPQREHRTSNRIFWLIGPKLIIFWNHARTHTKLRIKKNIFLAQF